MPAKTSKHLYMIKFCKTVYKPLISIKQYGFITYPLLSITYTGSDWVLNELAFIANSLFYEISFANLTKASVCQIKL